MTKPVIRAEHLGKQYRIGLAEVAPKSLREATINFLGAPFKYLRTMMRPPTEAELIWALRDVSFEVQQGEVLGIVGRNGAGKSTLLKILSRLTEPTTGYAEMRGRVASMLEVGTGFNPDLTGRENVYLNGTIMGMKKWEIDRNFDDIVDFAEIGKLIDTPVKRYSSGMYVRLAFAVAAHLEPEILIVDEVLAVGDAGFQKRCLGKIQDVSSHDGRTVLLVSHTMATVSTLSSSCLYLKQGKVASFGKPEAVIYQYLQDYKSLGMESLADRTDRSGNGRARVTNLRFLDAVTHQPLQSIISGQSIYVEVSYQSTDPDRKPISRFNIGLPFSNALGQFVMVLNSEMANRAFETVPAEGRVYCSVPHFPLMVGNFFVTINLYIGGELADHVENALSIEVENGDFFGTGIPNAHGRQGVYVLHSWSAEIE